MSLVPPSIPQQSTLPDPATQSGRCLFSRQTFWARPMRPRGVRPPRDVPRASRPCRGMAKMAMARHSVQPPPNVRICRSNSSIISSRLISMAVLLGHRNVCNVVPGFPSFWGFFGFPICIRRYKMSFNCVEMSLFISVKVSSFCLFSYTFRLRSSFINIFFFVPALNATNPPPPRPWNFPLRWMICPVFFASVWAFVLSLGDPVGALRSAPVPAILA